MHKDIREKGAVFHYKIEGYLFVYYVILDSLLIYSYDKKLGWMKI